MNALALVMVVLGGGCVVGGGPVLGYGEHGWVAAAEVGGGGAAVIPQAAVGYQLRHHLLYARVDETWDLSGVTRSDKYFGGRLGGGIGLDVDDGSILPMFVLGPGLGRVIGTQGSCGRWNTELLVEIQLRYAEEWQMVLAPRVEAASIFCN